MPALVAGIHVFLAVQSDKAWMAGTSPAKTSSIFSLVQRLDEECLELGEMLRHQTGCGGSRCRPAGIAWPLVRGADLVEHPFQVRLDEVPGAHVARLFLAPHELGLL